MSVPKHFKFILIGLALLAITSIIYKMGLLSNNTKTFLADESYQITYHFFFKTDSGATSIKTYLPKNNPRQKILSQKNTLSPSIQFNTIAEGSNLKGSWFTAAVNSYESISYSFVFKGKGQVFGLSQNFEPYPSGFESYLMPTENIQVSAGPISQLAANLKQGATSDKETVEALFNYVNNIPSAPIITLTDALSALERNKASCNGKSRLLVALARNLGYPARIKGGIILKESNKRTSHAWAELFINGAWVPFDALNGHFAYLPANYLEIYEGDEFLITNTPGIQFDYSYEIKEVNHVAFLRMNSEEISTMSCITLWNIVESGALLGITPD
ncbi:MAG: transglutaminase domain-containing protein, partial [Bacteroidota bacterium]